MNLPDRQRLGALVLIISGIAAFAAPFLIHSPSTQGNIGGTDGDTNDNNPGGGPKKKTLQDLKTGVEDCQRTDHGNGNGPVVSLLAKVFSAMRAEERAGQRAEHQTRTDQMAQHVSVLYSKLDNPSAETHLDSTCISEIRNIIGDL